MQTTFGESFLTWAENGPGITEHSMDLGHQLDLFQVAQAQGNPVALQLSKTLIRISQDMLEVPTGTVSYEVRLIGKGISPVSSLADLNTAINEGVAKGSFSHMNIMRAGETILAFDFAATGYTMTSGNQSLTVTGALPQSLTQLFDLAGLLSHAEEVNAMLPADRAAFFDELAAYGVTGLTAKDGTDTVFDLQVTSTNLHLAIEGTAFDVTGNFQVNFGQMAERLWELRYDPTQSDLSDADVLGATKITMSQDGVKLITLSHLDDDVTEDIVVGGKHYDQWKTDVPAFLGGEVWTDPHGNVVFRSWDAVIEGARGNVASVLAGLDGHDTLLGFSGRDLLYGGSGRDWLEGGAGTDILNGGSGFDKLYGGTGADVLNGNGDNDTLFGDDGDDRLNGGAGNDLMYGGAGDDVMIGGLGIDRMEGGAGNDLMKADAGSDRFLFNISAAPVDSDTITGFNVAEDKLYFMGNGSTFSDLGNAAFIAAYASVTGAGVLIHVDAGSEVLLKGLTSLTGLADTLILS